MIPIHLMKRQSVAITMKTLYTQDLKVAVIITTVMGTIEAIAIVSKIKD